MKNIFNKEFAIRLIISFLALAFGVMTIKSGGFALFGGVEGKIFAGNYIPFVLWFNFLAGFVYILTAIFIFLKSKWAVLLSLGLACSTALVFTGFALAIALGSPYEVRTIGAMTIRTLFWVVLYLFSRYASNLSSRQS